MRLQSDIKIVTLFHHLFFHIPHQKEAAVVWSTMGIYLIEERRARAHTTSAQHYVKHRCQPSGNRAGNPAYFQERPASLVYFEKQIFLKIVIIFGARKKFCA